MFGIQPPTGGGGPTAAQLAGAMAQQRTVFALGPVDV
jgi:hypothetical protein